MRTSLVASPVVSAGEILASLLMFAIVYALMFALWLFLLGRAIGKGPEQLEGESPARVSGDLAGVAR